MNRFNGPLQTGSGFHSAASTGVGEGCKMNGKQACVSARCHVGVVQSNNAQELSPRSNKKHCYSSPSVAARPKIQRH